MKVRARWRLALLVVVAAGCGTEAPPDLQAELAALRKADARAQQAVVDKDIDGVLSWLAEDATNYPPSAPAAVGRDAFVRSFEEVFALPGFAVGYPEPSRVLVSECGDLGYTMALEQITVNDSEGNPTTVQSRYLAVWKKQPDGSWKVIDNMWNFAEPAPSLMPAPANQR